MTRSAREARAMPSTWSAWAQCARLVRTAWVQGVHLCSQPSFDSVHCSESLFRTLFMDTVHEHCSRGFQK